MSACRKFAVASEAKLDECKPAATTDASSHGCWQLFQANSMSALDKFTAVIAIDSEHADELEAVWPTWVKFHPEILRIPMLVFFDTNGMAKSQLDAIHEMMIDSGANSQLVWFTAWDHHSSSTQREKMLSAFVFGAPQLVETPYWLKLDTDLIATSPGPLIRDEWLDGEPAFFSQRWGYTRPSSMLDQLDKWIAPLNPPNPPFTRKIVGDKAKHRRVISYFMGVNTDWSWDVVKMCGYHRMPVPSQDTIYSHVAERFGHFYRTIDVKAAGWRHVGSRSINKLRQAAAEAMK